MMDKYVDLSSELTEIFRMFFDDEPLSCRKINTSRGDTDFRETVIVKAVSGGKYVIKLADNDFTFPERIKMWQKTAEEYRALGYYCPRIHGDKSGGFPYVEYSGHKCAAFAEDHSVYPPLTDRDSDDGNNSSVYNRYRKDIWSMTARIAAKHLCYTEYPSAYCLFETFCPSDKVDEVLENALEWKKYADGLPSEFSKQVERIWKLWTENRQSLELVYKKLPFSVFQADLNSSNILTDENGSFAGISDFNLSGREVFLNYLMRENFGGFEHEIELIFDALKVSSEYYHFSDLEKDTALMLYRCLKPLWFCKLEQLKECGCDREKVGAYLDKTEYYLTADIDFKAFMQ